MPARECVERCKPLKQRAGGLVESQVTKYYRCELIAGFSGDHRLRFPAELHLVVLIVMWSYELCYADVQPKEYLQGRSAATPLITQRRGKTT